ncbi:hypothetical protein MYOV011v1_p0269 [Vibrio phage 6E35.1a]|nr:hypothetical protein MYOV011v1_p0269 [Vibrio phage 6E35.1a]
MTKFWQVALAVVGTILIPLSISSLSVATQYGGMQEALEIVQAQGETNIKQYDAIMKEITDIKLTDATQAQQLISLEGQQSLIVKKQDEMLVQYGRLGSSVESLRATSQAADENLRNSYDALYESQKELGIKIDARNQKDGRFEAELAKVQTQFEAVNSDRFTGSEADMLKERIDALDVRVEKLTDQK